jgi:hypothetical protein
LCLGNVVYQLKNLPLPIVPLSLPFLTLQKALRQSFKAPHRVPYIHAPSCMITTFCLFVNLDFSFVFLVSLPDIFVMDTELFKTFSVASERN